MSPIARAPSDERTPFTQRVPWIAALTAGVAAPMTVGIAWTLHAIGHGSATVAALFLASDLVPTAVAAVLGGLRPSEALTPGKFAAENEPAGVSVLVAAYQEESCILQTIASLREQATATFPVEILVADDGSTDATARLVEETQATEAADSRCTLRLLRCSHSGKGAALNAALAVATFPIVVTVDADTELGPEALLRLVRPFADPSVTAAAGAVVVRNHGAAQGRFLLRHQFVEYRKNTLLRRGWSALGVLDQVPGAFGAYRAAELRRAGGFPIDSLTEDYEAIFRLRALAADEGRSVQIPTIAEARAYTEGPNTVLAFARQRARWFAGFLGTMIRFRRLIFSPKAGLFGTVKLPLKLLDAILPLFGLVTLISLVLPGHAQPAGVSSDGVRTFGFVLAVRAFLEGSLYLRAAALAENDPRPRPANLLLVAMFEPFVFAWIKIFAVQRAYLLAAQNAVARGLRHGAWES